MARLLDDPLLGIGRGLILVCMAVVGIAAAGCVIGIPLALFGRERLLLAIAEDLPQTPASSTVWAIAGLLLLLTVLLALLFLFLRHMKRIVESVAEGDPFIPANAERLTAMAWLILGVQVLALPVGALGALIERSLSEDVDSISFEFDLNSLVLILTLFILARVFRRGAQMRDELEGTV